MHLIYKIACTASYAFFDTLFNIEPFDLHHLPESGPYILASNHTSYFDPPAIACCITSSLHFLARKSLFKSAFAGWLLPRLNAIPIDRGGHSDIGAIRTIIGLLQAGYKTVLFPEGTRSETGLLQPGKRGIGLIACKAQVPIVPVRIWGTFEGLKRGEWLPCLQDSILVGFGPPLYPIDFDNKQHSDRYQNAADQVMKAINAIEKPIDLQA